MLPPDRSPVHQVVRLLRSAKPHGPHLPISAAFLRAKVYQAVYQECVLKLEDGTEWDPSKDSRVKLALECVEIIQGARRSFTPGLEDAVKFLMWEPAPVSGKDRAAGETFTLAQGS